MPQMDTQGAHSPDYALASRRRGSDRSPVGIGTSRSARMDAQCDRDPPTLCPSSGILAVSATPIDTAFSDGTKRPNYSLHMNIRQVAVVAMSVALAATLAACGGAGPAALSANLSAVEAFFSSHGGSTFLVDRPPSPSPSEYTENANVLYAGGGTTSTNRTDCFVHLTGPKKTTKVDLISVGCGLAALTSFADSCVNCDASASLLTAVLQDFVPTATSWTQQSLKTNIEGPYVSKISKTKTFGACSVAISTTTNPEFVDLRITPSR